MNRVINIKFRNLFFAASLILLNSCSDSTGPESEPIIISEIPVISGIIITNINGPEEIGRWRNPFYPSGVSYGAGKIIGQNYEDVPIPFPSIWDMYNPHPNPTTDNTVIRFNLPAAAEVSVWIVRGKLPEDDLTGVKSGSGGIFISTVKHFSAVIIMDQEYLAAGMHQVYFSGKTGDEYVPTGFYRIYLKAGEHLFWRDILIARSKADLPPELRDEYFYVGKAKE